jgi:hypothetical protein
MPTPTASATPAAATLLSLSLGSDYSLSLILSPWLIAVLILSALLTFALRSRSGRFLGAYFEIDKAEVGLGSGKISFKPNRADQQIAYAIWVELSTRKIGLPIDLKHDVVSEIYESWYTFFSITRDLIKDIPVNKVKNDSTRKIITLSIDVLNQGLRPHLTTWQARFRYWYERELAKAVCDSDPQSIQARYPRFQELEADLLQVNSRLIRYRGKMRELVLGLSDDAGDASPTFIPEAPKL